jgi:hypothetical protein
MGTAGVSIASAAAGEEDTAAAVVETAAAEKTAAAVPMQVIAEAVERQAAPTAVASLVVMPLQVALMQQ